MTDTAKRFVNIRIELAGRPEEPFDAFAIINCFKGMPEIKPGSLSFLRLADGSEAMVTTENSWTPQTDSKC